MERLIEWTTGHQEVILESLPRSIGDFVLRRSTSDPTWNRANTRLAVTGDLTAIGDAASMDHALDVVDRISAEADAAAWVIHGNHDVWSGNPSAPLPIYFGNRALRKQHRRAVAQVIGAMGGVGEREFPLEVGKFKIRQTSTGPQHLVVWAINTVTHEPLANSVALGEAALSFHDSAGESQIEALKKRLDPGDVNIVLCHHPVYDKFNGLSHERDPVGRMCLVDGREVCSELGPIEGGRRPRVSVFLSGHVHNMYPEPGKLSEKRPDDCFLHKDQHQLVVGTACQDTFPTDPDFDFARRRPDGKGFDPRCYWQALTFVYNDGGIDGRGARLVLTREIFRRDPKDAFRQLDEVDSLEIPLDDS